VLREGLAGDLHGLYVDLVSERVPAPLLAEAFALFGCLEAWEQEEIFQGREFWTFHVLAKYVAPLLGPVAFWSHYEADGTLTGCFRATPAGR
jgi:hypothetical protein